MGKKIIICSFKINPQLRMFEFIPHFLIQILTNASQLRVAVTLTQSA